MHSASPVSTSSQVTMSVRLPEGWEPPFLLVFFPLCIPSPIAGLPHPGLVAERTESGVGAAHSGSVGGLRLPNVPTHGIPQYSWGTSFSPGQLKGKLRGSSGLRRGKAWTTPSPVLLGIGSGWGPGAQVWKRLHILETSRAHNRPEDWWPPASSAGAEPSPKGRQSQPTPAAAHLAHTCWGQEDSGADSPPVPAVLGRGGPGGHIKDTQAIRLLTKASRASLSLTPTWNCQTHMPRSPQPQRGSKGSSSTKPPLTPQTG